MAGGRVGATTHHLETLVGISPGKIAVGTVDARLFTGSGGRIAHSKDGLFQFWIELPCDGMADVVTEIPRSDKEDINAVDLCDFLNLDRTTDSQISQRSVDWSNGAGKPWSARGEVRDKVGTYHIQSLFGLDLNNGEEMIVGIPHVLETRQIALDVKGSHGKGTAEASLADWGKLCGLDQLLGVFDRVQ